MKHLHLFDEEIDFETAKETLEFPWLCFVEETSKSVCMSTYKPNTSVWYKIEDNILYIRGNNYVWKSSIFIAQWNYIHRK